MTTTSKPPPGGYFARVLKKIHYFIVLVFANGLYSLCIDFFKRPKRFELPSRSGDVAVMTGGGRGIGLEIIKILLQSDFTVILGVRNVEGCEGAIRDIRSKGISSGKTVVLPLDLTSISSVRTFAEKVLQQTSRLDLLINNAGIMFGPYEETEDGYESQFQTNYLSHFLLTNLLLPRLKETGSYKKCFTRVINVSSTAHFGGSLDFTDLEKCKVYADNKSYQDSKLAQVLHAKYLDKMLADEGAKVRVYSLHPGMINTGLWNNMAPIIRFFVAAISCIFRTTTDGAWTVMYAALSPELEDKGGCFINSNEIVSPNSAAEDESLQKLLWERSLQLVNPDYIKTHGGFYNELQYA